MSTAPTIPTRGGGSLNEHFIPYLAYRYALDTAVIPYAYNVYISNLHVGAFNRAAIRHFASTKQCKPWSAGHVYRLYGEFAGYFAEFAKLGGEVPAIDTHKPDFFCEDYSFRVLHHLDIFRSQIMTWSIMRDPRMEFDFFCTSGNLRFYFRGCDHALYMELSANHAAWLEVRLWLGRELCTPQARACLDNLHAYLRRGVRWPEQLSVRYITRQGQDGDAQISLAWCDITGCSAVLETLCDAAWALLCRPLGGSLQSGQDAAERRS